MGTLDADWEWHVYRLTWESDLVTLTENAWQILHKSKLGEFLAYGAFSVAEFMGIYETYEDAENAVRLLEAQRRTL